MSVFKIFISLSFFLLASSCETILTLQEVDPSLAASSSGRIILATQIEAGKNIESSCVITFKSLSTNAVIAASLAKRGIPRVFLAPAGKYSFDRLRCAGRRQFELSDILPYQFVVVEEKTGLVGSLSIKFDEKKDQAFLRLSDGRKIMHKEFQEVIKKSRQPVISAYNEKPVTPSMYALGGEGTWNSQLLFDPQASPKSGRPASPSLDPVFDCDRTEFDWNPLRLGSLQISFDFEEGTLKKTDLKDSVHLFSDAFVVCIKNSGKLFKNVAKGSSKLQLSFK